MSMLKIVKVRKPRRASFDVLNKRGRGRGFCASFSAGDLIFSEKHVNIVQERDLPARGFACGRQNDYIQEKRNDEQVREKTQGVAAADARQTHFL